MFEIIEATHYTLKHTRSGLINTPDRVTASIFMGNTQPLNLSGIYETASSNLKVLCGYNRELLGYLTVTSRCTS